MPAPEPRRLTSVERRWLAVVVAPAAELAALLLPRARADSYEGFFSTYYDAGVPTELRGPVEVNGLFFGASAAIELALKGIVAMLATALLLRRDFAAGLRWPALVFAALLPLWATVAALWPGIDDGVPFVVLAGGYVGLGAAVVVGLALAALSLAPAASAPPAGP